MCPNNTVTEAKDFYVSHLRYSADYEGETTALVVGQMEHFYILKGNHEANYKKLIPEGFDACLKYFKDNIAQIHEYSERP